MGIFPFFEYASSSVRLEVLDIIRTFYIPLGASLQSCLQSLVVSLLPGLEEENGDHFLRCLQIFDDVSNAVSKACLTEKIWTAMLVSHKHRLAAINFFTRTQSSNLDSEDGKVFCMNDSELVVCALCKTLEDHNILVVRGVLDLILTCFALDTSDLIPELKVRLTCSVLSILTRRDMSLNRRVYAWITGVNETDVVADPMIKCEDIVIRALRHMLATANISSFECTVKPYKILLYLNDKSYIMRPLFGALVYELLRTLFNLNPAKVPFYEKVIISMCP